MRNSIYILIFCVFCTSFFAQNLSLKRHLISTAEWEANFRDLVMLEQNTLEQFSIKESAQTSSPFLTFSQMNLEILSSSVILSMKASGEWSDNPLAVLPSSWSVTDSNLPLYGDGKNHYLIPDSNEKTLVLTAKFFFASQQSIFRIPLPFLPVLKGFIKGSGNMVARLHIQGGKIRRLSMDKEQDWSLSHALEIERQDSPLAHQEQIINNPSLDTSIQTKRMIQETSLFVRGLHELYFTSAKILILASLNLKAVHKPCQKIKLNLPQGLNLLEVSGVDHFSKSGELRFDQGFLDEKNIQIKAEMPVQSQFSMLSVSNAIEETGIFGILRDDLVSLEELLFQNPEVLRRLDLAEIPEDLTLSLPDHLWQAFAFVQDPGRLQIRLRLIDPIATSKHQILNFSSRIQINPDFSSLQNIQFRVDSLEEGLFALPLPKGAEIKSCRMDGKNIKLLKKDGGDLYVSLEKITPPSLNNQNFAQSQQVVNAQNLFSQTGVNLEMQVWQGAKETKQLHFSYPLPAHAQNIRVHIDWPKGMKPSVQTNLQPNRSFKQVYPSLAFLSFLSFMAFILIVSVFVKTHQHKSYLVKTGAILCALFFWVFGFMLLYQETKLFNKGVEIFSSVSAKDYFLPYATVQGVFMALDFSPSFLPLSSVLTHLLIIVSALLLLLFLRRSWEAFGLFLIFMHLVFLILHQGEFIAPLAWYLWFPAWFLVLLILDSIRLYRSLFLLFMGISCYQAAELDVYLFPQGKETFHFVKKEAWLNLNKKPEPEKSNYFPYARAEWFLKKREHSIELILRLQKPLPGAEEFLLDPPFEGARSVQKEVKSSDEIQFVWPEKEIEHFSFQALKAPSQTLYLHWNNQVLVQDLTPGERFFPASMLPKKENLEIAASIQKLEVKSKQDFEIDQSRFNFKAQFSFTATNQEVLDFQLPQGLKISIVDGMELDWKQTENQLRLNFTSPQNAGSFRMEGSLITESRTEVMSLVELPEAWRSEHKIHLFAAPAITLKVQPAQASIGSVRLIEEIPDQDFVFERIIQGRKSEKASLIVQTKDLGVVQTAQTYLDRILARCYLHQDMNLYCNYRLVVRNNGQQFLRLSGQWDQILGASLNGELLNLGKEGQQILLPLVTKQNPQNREEILSFLVDLTTVSMIPAGPTIKILPLKPDALVSRYDLELRQDRDFLIQKSSGSFFAYKEEEQPLLTQTVYQESLRKRSLNVSVPDDTRAQKYRALFVEPASPPLKMEFQFEKRPPASYQIPLFLGLLYFFMGFYFHPFLFKAGPLLLTTLLFWLFFPFHPAVSQMLSSLIYPLIWAIPLALAWLFHAFRRGL